MRVGTRMHIMKQTKSKLKKDLDAKLPLKSFRPQMNSASLYLVPALRLYPHPLPFTEEG